MGASAPGHGPSARVPELWLRIRWRNVGLAAAAAGALALAAAWPGLQTPAPVLPAAEAVAVEVAPRAAATGERRVVRRQRGRGRDRPRRRSTAASRRTDWDKRRNPRPATVSSHSLPSVPSTTAPQSRHPQTDAPPRRPERGEFTPFG